MRGLTIFASHDDFLICRKRCSSCYSAQVKMLKLLVVLLIVVLACQCEATIDSDEVTSLPGWDGPLPSKQYSGYVEINATTGKTLHYWLVESKKNPTNDPLVLWLNGGPGCSSMDGYFNELGPLHFDRNQPDDGRFPTLKLNPWSWTNISNVMFLETPAGVGFSYSNDPATDYHYTDELAAQDNCQFLVNWFQKYPEYQKNDFYVMGESYAGIYVPTLVSAITAHNAAIGKGASGTRINLKGFAVGNGCTGKDTGGCSGKEGVKIHVDFYNHHGLISDELYNEIIQTCNFSDTNSQNCLALLQRMSKTIGPVNIYDIYTKCLMNMTSVPSEAVWRARNPVRDLLESAQTNLPPVGPLDCIDDHIERLFFDNEKVRQAIHVQPLSKIGGWHMCTMRIDYHSTISSLLPQYPALIKQYRTLIYNGDVDGCVPFNGNEAWTSGLGFTVKNGGWRPWLVEDQVAGYVTEYDTNGFQFVTVKGSGHMVPQYRPKSAYYMFERFLSNTPM